MESYSQTLQKLFKAVKHPSRHANSEQSTLDIFHDRKNVYSNMFRSSCGDNVPQVIHVAGTKGKGSTVELLASAIRSQDKTVGVFTSPHLHTARERIKIGKSLISIDDFVKISDEVYNELSPKPWAVFFDYLLGMAIRYFGQKQCEYVILETGIGGRYDSTNFVDRPAVEVITSISLDHQALLGDTVEQIAWQKAGIIKPNTHVFTSANQQGSVLEVFRKQCDEVNATLHEIPAEKSVVDSLGFNITHDTQIENICLANAVLQYLNISSAGMKNFYWPCRMEVFETNDCTVVLDGCHNGESVHLFLNAIRKKYPNYEVWTLFGAGMEKCLNDMLEHVMTLSDRVVMVQSSHFKSLSEQKLVELSTQQFPDKNQIIIADAVHDDLVPGGTVGTRLRDVTEQFEKQRHENNNNNNNNINSNSNINSNNSVKPAVIVCCGSLFVASEAREELFRLRPDLFAEDDWVRECDNLA